MVLTERIINEGKFIVINNSTVRVTAKAFGVSKSTVHKDLTERLYMLDRALFYKVKEVLNKNLEERHLRGGTATKLKYQRKKFIQELEKRINNYNP